MDDPEYATWLAREVAELDEYVLPLLGIECMSIDIPQDRELFVETVSIVFGEIGVENGTSFFDKK